jgi:hypothetical protein
MVLTEESRLAAEEAREPVIEARGAAVVRPPAKGDPAR